MLFVHFAARNPREKKKEKERKEKLKEKESKKRERKGKGGRQQGEGERGAAAKEEEGGATAVYRRKPLKQSPSPPCQPSIFCIDFYSEFKNSF